MSLAEKLAKPANLSVLDHEGFLLGTRGNQIVNRQAREGGNSNCRWQGILIVADQGDGRYDVFYASADLGEPNWESLPPFDKVLETAFKGKIIDRADHPIVRRLQGVA